MPSKKLLEVSVGGEDKISGTCQIIGKISKTKRATFSNWKERLLNV